MPFRRATLALPSAGVLELGGRGVIRARTTPTVARVARLHLRLRDALRRRLREEGSLVVRPALVFDPGVDAAAKRERVRVKLLFRP